MVVSAAAWRESIRTMARERRCSSWLTRMRWGFSSAVRDSFSLARLSSRPPSSSAPPEMPKGVWSTVAKAASPRSADHFNNSLATRGVRIEGAAEATSMTEKMRRLRSG